MNNTKIKWNALIYFPGIFISIIGSVLFSFSTSVYLIETTKTGITYATNILLFSLPIVVLSPFLGKLCDRYSKKK